MRSLHIKHFPKMMAMGFLACTFLCLAAERPWIEVRSPNFIVISDASAKNARRTAYRFEQFRSVIKTALPKLRVDPGSPLVVFAGRNSDSLKNLLPLENSSEQRPGLFLDGPERDYVVLRIDVPGDQGYRVIYHEYVHMIMRLNFPILPLWVSEGLADFYGHATISSKSSDLGKPSPEMLQILKSSRLLPLDVLMSVDHESPYYQERDKTPIFYAQSWALTHYLLVSDEGARANQLNEYLRMIRDGVYEQEAAKRAFGDLKILERNLEGYVRSLSFNYYRVSVQLDEEEDQYATRTLSLADSLAVRGNLLIHTNRMDEARDILDQSMRLDYRSAAANEGMGLLYLRLQDHARALKYFAAAAELDSLSFMALYYAARSAYERGADADLGIAEGYLRKALALNPLFVPAYHLLSYVLVQQEEKRAEEALNLAKKAAELEPAEFRYQINIGQILLVMDRIDEAHSHGKRLLSQARTNAERQMAESFLASVEFRQNMMLESARRAEAQRAHSREWEDQIPTTRVAPEQAETSIETGPDAKVKGVIRSVKCEFPAIMDLVLDAGGTQHKLRAKNYYEVQYWAADSGGRDDFEPCSELEGKLVQIEYVTVLNQDYDGVIDTILIEK